MSRTTDKPYRNPGCDEFVVPSGKKVVLVVDDEPDLLEGLRGIIEQEMGVNTLGAGSGHAALELLARQHTDLIVSDFKMPKMDGCAFLLQAAILAPKVPQVLMSAFLDAQGEAQVRGLHATFFPKPIVDLEGFVDVLRHSMN
jgi:CheY-like chemotaxis protein